VDAERGRLEDAQARRAHWKRWGPYLAERQWGTVREDYSPDGTAWTYFPHAHARSRAYRWGEDGIAGISDNHQRLCFALGLWNGRDPILKERLFGLSPHDGNHGEDVKECYFYLDSTPTHSFMRYLYKYPQAAFPYGPLAAENARRDRTRPEYELLDTGVFDDDRYFDVLVEYAKATTDDVLVTITAAKRGADPADLDLLPTLWFRNTWSWTPGAGRPQLRARAAEIGHAVVSAEHPSLGHWWLLCEGLPELLVTENETNFHRLWGTSNQSPYVKDGIDACVVRGARDAVNPYGVGTKATARYHFRLAPGETVSVRLRLADAVRPAPFGPEFDRVVAERRREADDFYATVIPAELSDDARGVMRQAFAGLLWSKQFYHYDVSRWADGDPAYPPPPANRAGGRNQEWRHLYNEDVISMPDKWEYPWYAAWDLAFHAVALALVDSDFAKAQLVLFLREWYMHPNGQIPAYEWAFGDVNPPVHAWATWRVYKIEERRRGTADRKFLERVFHKLLLNFTWWVNRKDAGGRNIFQGGFLGLDNIGVFDRSAPLPVGGRIEQSDGTAWMAMYCLNMLVIALELARDDDAYEDVASKFFEHFVYIAHAMDDRDAHGIALWDDKDGFFYDALRCADDSRQVLKVRSMVGLIPLFAAETLENDAIDRLPGFKRRMQWFIDNRTDLRGHVEIDAGGAGTRRLLSIVGRDQLVRVLNTMLDETEFLSAHGVRALSRVHLEHPYTVRLNGTDHRVSYEPGDSTTGLFGGNSNWRGPVWFPVNFLLVEALQKFDHFYGDGLKVECPSGSGRLLTLAEVACELSQRLTGIFLRAPSGRRPVHGDVERFASDPHWRDLVLFYEYFHGDTGRGLGASHQTGWTGLVAKLLQQSGERPPAGSA
jgi:hypothetical protein